MIPNVSASVFTSVDRENLMNTMYNSHYPELKQKATNIRATTHEACICEA